MGRFLKILLTNHKKKQELESRKSRQNLDRFCYSMLNQLLKMCYYFNIDSRSLNRLYEQKVSINVKYSDE